MFTLKECVHTIPYLHNSSCECFLVSHGEIGGVDEHIPICTSTDYIAVIKGGGQVCNCPIMVVMHGKDPVGVEGGDGVGLG